MLNEDLLGRVTKIRNLREECFKYLEESSKELLTHQIIFAMAKLSCEKMGPVKLAEIATIIFGQSDKAKQDTIRLTIEKSLLKCGVVEKLHYAPNDVRYILTSYRFQKIRKIESFRGDNAEPIGEVFEIPRSLWPLPDEYFILKSRRRAYEDALKKLNADYDFGKVQHGEYEDLTRELDRNLGDITRKLNAKFASMAELD